MKITKDTVAILDYRLHLGDGEVVDEGSGDTALIYLHGYEEIVPGLEQALEGKSAGETFKVVVKPEDAYGEYDEELVEEVGREHFPEELALEAGGVLSATDEDGDEVDVLIKEIREKTVLVDSNHVLAGKTLHFEITVREVRAGTPEEIEHGHVHLPGDEH